MTRAVRTLTTKYDHLVNIRTDCSCHYILGTNFVPRPETRYVHHTTCQAWTVAIASFPGNKATVATCVTLCTHETC